MNLQNYPLNLPKANYFGAESMQSGWVGSGRVGSWANSINSKFQTPQQRVALFGKEEDIDEPEQIAMARTSKGDQYVADTEQQIDAKPESMLEGIEVTDMLDPLEGNNPLENTKAQIEFTQPQ